MDDLSELHTTSSATSTLHHNPAPNTSTNTATSSQQLPRLPGYWTVKLRSKPRAKLELPVKLRPKPRAKLQLPVKLRPRP